MPNQEVLHITRTTPDLNTLQKRYRKEKEGEIVRRLSIIIHMLLLGSVQRVAELVCVSDDTVRRWVTAFNQGGLEALTKKNDADAPRS
jgi:transposase